MRLYTIVVICAIVISAIIMFLIFIRLKLLNFRILFSVTLASLISAIALPGIFYIVSANQNGVAEIHTLLLITVVTISIYIILAFILSMIISRAFPGIAAKPGASESQISDAASKEADMVKAAPVAETGTVGAISSAAKTAEDEIAGAAESVPTEDETANVNYLEQIYDNMVRENNKETTNHVENEDKLENNFEKSVDSSGNIDKMGIENKVRNSEILTISECIEEAFRLKEQGDAEGAILYYMYALDKKPHKELTFWIVLDICVLYKTLGQYELAFDILNSYYDVFGDIMGASVREEIERNLSDIQA